MYKLITTHILLLILIHASGQQTGSGQWVEIVAETQVGTIFKLTIKEWNGNEFVETSSQSRVAKFEWPNAKTLFFRMHDKGMVYIITDLHEVPGRGNFKFEGKFNQSSSYQSKEEFIGISCLVGFGQPYWTNEILLGKIPAEAHDISILIGEKLLFVFHIVHSLPY